MSNLKFSALLVLISLLSITAQAQTSKDKSKLSLNNGTIDNQFEYVIQKSYTYRGNGKIYKNVERHWLYTLKAHTLDSLKAIQDKLDTTKKVVNTQQTEINQLHKNFNENITDYETQISDLNAIITSVASPFMV